MMTEHEWFYCGKVDRRGRLLLKQKKVKRVCQEICETRCKKIKTCKAYKEQINGN